MSGLADFYEKLEKGEALNMTPSQVLCNSTALEAEIHAANDKGKLTGETLHNVYLRVRDMLSLLEKISPRLSPSEIDTATEQVAIFRSFLEEYCEKVPLDMRGASSRNE